MISAKDIQEAHKRIKPFIHHTPVLSSNQINRLLGCSVYFKCENFQKVGAFKARGAFNFALQLNKAELRNGLCTHSSGNHAQAVALAAKQLNTQAYIVMPNNAPQVKVDAVKAYGAEIIFCEPTLQAREINLAEIQNKTNAVFIHPYNHQHIIAGQATSALELVKEIPEIDTLICPVGGGGMLAGTSLSAKYFGTNIDVFGAEPKGADDAKKSFDAQKIIPSINPKHDSRWTAYFLR